MWKNKIKSFLANKTTKNASWLIFGRVLQMLINFFVNIYTTRFLGPANYGIINYGTTYTNFFLSLCALGINSVLVKELVNNKDNQGTVLGTSLVLKGISSFISAFLILGIVSVADADDPTTILVVFLCSIGLIFNVLETFNYWFQSRLQSKVTAIAVFLGYIITAAYKTYLIISGKSVVYFSIATSLDYVCVGAVLFIFYKKNKGPALKFSWAYGKKLLKTSCHFILPSLMVSIYAQTDKLMLKHMISEEEIGFYSNAVQLCTAWCFVLHAIIDSVYPGIMEKHKAGDMLGFEKQNKILYALIFYVSFAASVFFCVFAEPIILLLYGEAFRGSVAPLRIVTWYTAFSYLGVARNAWIVCKDKQKYLIWVYASAAIANVILNTLLIPSMGSSGAALASLLAQIITTMVTPFFIPALRPNAKLMLDAIFLKGLIGNKKQE